MRKLIAAINLTLDGFCDHTAINPDDEIHDHYAELIRNSGVLLYGRITFQLMEYWQNVVENPTGNKAYDQFAMIMDEVPKIVFSNTLKQVSWKSATLAGKNLLQEVTGLKKQPGKDILAGSRSLILQLMKLNLIDEYQFCVHPVLAGSGLKLFENITGTTVLKLIKTKEFTGGAVILYYEPENGETANH